MYKVLNDRIEMQWVTPAHDEDAEVEWGYKPYKFNISYNGNWFGTSQIIHTNDGFCINKSSQPKLPESYPRENLDILFGLDGG
jgi:hypothetical protein